MFDHPPELASDLEWMLSSGQANLLTLTAALVDAYAFEIYRLCLCLTAEHITAERLVQEIFAAALSNIDRFQSGRFAQSSHTIRPDYLPSVIEENSIPTFERERLKQQVDGVRLWMLSLAIEHARRASRFQRLSTQHPAMILDEGRESDQYDLQRNLAWQVWQKSRSGERPVVLLYYLHECSTSDIAQLLRVKEKTVNSTLDAFRKRVGRLMVSPYQGSGVTGFDERLKEYFFTALVSLQPAELDTRWLITAIGTRSNYLSRRRQVTGTFLEIIFVVIVILVVWGVVWGYNQLNPLPESATVITFQTVIVTPTADSITSNSDPIQDSPLIGKLISTPAPEFVYYIVQPGDSLDLVAKKFTGIALQDLIDLNRLVPGEPLFAGWKLLIPSEINTSILPTATPLVDDREEGEQPETDPNTPQLFRRYRWFTDSWETIWVDAIIKEYPAHVDAGAITSSRLQTWLSKSHLLALFGEPGEEPQQVLLSWFDRHRYFIARLEDRLGWYVEIEPEQAISSPLVRNYLSRLFNPFYPPFEAGRRSFQMLGIGRYNGHEVEMLEGRNAGGWLISRLWIDREAGLVLRNQRFSGDRQERLLFEIIVTDWAYNITFPVDLFDPRLPWRGGFAQDFSGMP